MGCGKERVGFRNIPLLILSAVLLLDSQVFASEFTGQVVSILDGDTIEILHEGHPVRIRLPQSQRHSKERRNPLNRKNGEAHTLACHQLGLLTPKIRPASPQNTATNKATIIIGSIITS